VNAYPNPFNSEATIQVTTPISPQRSTITLFNIIGQSVRKEILPPFSGTYAFHLYAGDLPTGVYLAHVQSGDLNATQKLMLLK
jgi:hypothetical protein